MIPEQPDVIALARAILLANATGTPIDGVPVRGGDMEPGDEPDVIVLEESGALHLRDAAFFSPFRVRCSTYGSTTERAAEMWRAASTILHNRGPLQMAVDGHLMYVGRIFDEQGSQPLRDPDTNWPARWGVFGFYMSDQVAS